MIPIQIESAWKGNSDCRNRGIRVMVLFADLNFGSARQRVAALALKMRDPDQPGMTSVFARDDMGAMLDIKLETVSREISSLVRDGALKPCDKQGRRCEIINENLLMP
ncbi:helix-turn-helix domain-containing protein [Limnohabitans sp.]|uniref:helix-turn-helix domain-containing protein n=1 Tax=Limnohabitans sp. TaxID=1907725 RepID=UPI0039BD0734|nr:helix-turn-helix domain-containing protein [Comamonadaceae bacterium]